jgi:hypothetical protein
VSQELTLYSTSGAETRFYQAAGNGIVFVITTSSGGAFGRRAAVELRDRLTEWIDEYDAKVEADKLIKRGDSVVGTLTGRRYIAVSDAVDGRVDVVMLPKGVLHESQSAHLYRKEN